MINKIHLAVDGSEDAQRATETAVELAVKLKADFFIVPDLMHDHPPDELVRI